MANNLNIGQQIAGKIVILLVLLLCIPANGFSQETPPTEPVAPAPVPAPTAPSSTPPAPPAPPSVVPAVPQLPAEQAKPVVRSKEESYIILNFDNANLRDVINTVSAITEENFIISPGVDARVTIHSTKKVPVSEILSIFESILEINGLSMVKSGLFYKIIQGPSAKQRPVDIFKSNENTLSPATDIPITQIVPVEYIPANEANSVLQPLLSPFGSIIPNPRNNLLIINDLASNIKRLLDILAEIDVNAFQNTRMKFFQPKYSDVKTLSKELTEIINALNIGKEGVAFIPLERINSMIVFSSSPNLLSTVEDWIKKLDEESTTGQNIFVYRVQNGKADGIASILKTLYESDDSGKPTATVTAPPPTPGGKQTSPAAQAKPGETGFSRVKIITYEPTNSLVILASSGMYRDISETIKRLDVYPKEVLIEVLIAEIELSDSMQFGIQWSLLGKNIKIEGSSFDNLIQSSYSGTSALSATAPTLASGASGGLSYLLFKPDKFVGLINALASDGKVNVLSSPRLLVRDQQEASIEVGSDIPTATSSSQASDTTATVSQSIQYKTIGVKLKIKPNINDEKTIVLDVTQEVSEQGADISIGAAGYKYPSFTKREVKTSVVVPDQQGLIIGGIIKEKKNKSFNGIPLLSSIPILGYLFRYTTESSTKTELIVMLTPHVVSKKEEADMITSEFLDKIKGVRDTIDEYMNKSKVTEGNPQAEQK
ncbi:MAG: type II secretion system secretin GspD [Nitrospirae bacterium]|nr:type II secretion system secretin GspD [Nitrospirota bacterium]